MGARAQEGLPASAGNCNSACGHALIHKQQLLPLQQLLPVSQSSYVSVPLMRNAIWLPLSSTVANGQYTPACAGPSITHSVDTTRHPAGRSHCCELLPMRTQPGVLVRVSFVEAQGAQICRARAPHRSAGAASAKTCFGHGYNWYADSIADYSAATHADAGLAGFTSKLYRFFQCQYMLGPSLASREAGRSLGSGRWSDRGQGMAVPA
jgi:hypothetical protein